MDKFLVGSCDEDIYDEIISRVLTLGTNERFVIEECAYLDLAAELAEQIELEYDEVDEVKVI